MPLDEDQENGRTANCKQRFRCKNCGRQFITTFNYLGRVESVRELIVPMTLNGCGVRDVPRVLFVIQNTALKTLRAAAAIPGLPVPSKVMDLEIDEFWPFVSSKRQPRWKVSYFHTYGWPSYRRVLPQRRHSVSKCGTL
jgi:hypothetical protein